MPNRPNPDSIALFPLPNVILFPGLSLPLHIFEPRYQAMIADVRAGNGLVGMVLLNGAAVPNAAGDPAIFPVGCAGTVDQFEMQDDGRSHLLLRGTQRFRVRAEHSERPYRIAAVEWLEDETSSDPPAGVAPGLLTALEELLRRDGRSFDGDLADHLPDDPAIAVNTLAFAMELNVIEKMALLECDSAADRAERLRAFVDFRLAGPAHPSSDGERIVH